MRRRIDYARLPTEQVHPASRGLDCRSTTDILRLMNQEDRRVPGAVATVLPSIRLAVDRLVAVIDHGGRIFFLGAGTSGRLGVIEAAECPPTFNTPSTLVQPIIAGGRAAVFRSREGAEDDRLAARQAVRRRVRRGDAVIGIAASGVTPFVDAGLRAAALRGARTMLVTCARRRQIRVSAEVIIAPAVGPELIAGSTRLKAATATKLILNMLTVATMVRLGKVYDHRMVDVQPRSRKLTHRAGRIIQELTHVSPARARHCLQAADGDTTLAIVMAAKALTAQQAARVLRQAKGRLRRALEA